MSRCLVGRLDDLAIGSLTRVDPGGVPVCLVRLADGEVYAISDVCSHEDVELSDGELEGDAVECPAHGSAFDARTGAVSGLPATKDVPAYPVTITDGEIFVEVPS